MSLVRSPANDARFLVTANLALLGAMLLRGQLHADSYVNFWISNVDAGPVAPVIYVPPGATRELDVWARPAPGYRLAGFSLDLVAESAGVVTFEAVDVLNPPLQAMPAVSRHQVTFDSASGLEVAPSTIDSFLGFSFFDDSIGLPNGAGMGPMCGIDPECSSASGATSWRIATVLYHTNLSFGTTELYLQIGEQGLWQSPDGAAEPDPPSNTSAIFGSPGDAINEWAVLGGGTDHRHSHQGMADAVIQVATADFDQDVDVDGADLLTWQRGFGPGGTLAAGDANGDRQINGADLAVWQYQFGAFDAALPIGSGVPEPMGLGAVWTIVILCGVHRRRLATRR